MAIKSFKRYEKKFIIDKDKYDELIEVLLQYMDYDDYCKGGKDYNIYNLYYDTENDDVIRHSIFKPYYKEKLRLRSYKTPKSLDEKVFLEIKKKINGIVSKRRVVMTLAEAYDFLEIGNRPRTDDYINNQVLNEIEYYLQNNKVYPKVYISYSRKALFGKNDREFRVTFDSNIITRRENITLEAGSYGEELLEKNQYLMEVKILGAMPLWLAKELSSLEVYNTHFSKYGDEYKRYVLEKQSIDTRRREKIC